MNAKAAKRARRQWREARASAAAEPTPDSLPDVINLRPDGYYWQAPDGAQEFGPFESYELASADIHTGEEGLAPDESLPEVEDQIGIAGWIDAETGAPAEGQSPPHLEER